MRQQLPSTQAKQGHNSRVPSARPRRDQVPTPRPGLRERKRARTFSEIQREALRLFVAQGYEQTTIEQIAEAAEVSPSTIFRYFPTKEDLVLTDEYDALILTSLAAGPTGEPGVTALRRVLAETLGDIVKQDPSMFLTRGRLMLGVPALHARLWGFLQENEAVLCQVFADHSGRDPEDFELRVAAGAIIGTIMAALTEWIQSDGQADMAALLDRALHLLETGLANVGTNPHTP
jgi:AcrR family transcriptional regulator